MASTAHLKQLFRQVIDSASGTDPYELRRVFNETIREWEMKTAWDEPARHMPWTDDQLRSVLSDAPTRENCLKHARAFGRGYGSIEQIYRWAATPDADVKAVRPDDAFVAQVKRVAKQLGWRA